MKRTISLLLSLMLVFSFNAFSVMAEAASADSAISGTTKATADKPMYNILSDTIWNFEAVQHQKLINDTDTEYIHGGVDVAKTNKMGGYFNEPQSWINYTDSTLNYDTDAAAMKVHIERGTYNKGTDQYGRPVVSGGTSTTGKDRLELNSCLTNAGSDVNVRFTLKAPASGTGGLCLRSTGTGAPSKHFQFVMIKNGKLELCGTEIADITANEWYTYDVRVNMAERYARLYVTPGRNADAMNGKITSDTKFYDVSFDSLAELNATTFDSFNSGYSVARIMLGFATATTSDWYVGEWYQNKLDKALRPTYESLNSDFGTDCLETSGTTQKYQSKWTSGHKDQLAFVNDGVAEVKSNENGARARISRYPFRNNTAPKRRYRMDVSVGGAAGSSVALDMGNNIYTLSYLQTENEMRLASGETAGQATGMSKNYKSAAVAMSANEKTPLRVKVFYDETNRKGVVGVESNGKLTWSEFSIPSSETAAFKGISLYAAGSGNSAYYDDFTWDITPSSVDIEEAAKIAYTDANAANLDETVTFTYSETLRQPDSAPEIIVKAGENAVATGYEISYQDNKMLVHFSDLNANTKYTVTAPALTTLSGLSTENLVQSIEFTTAETGVVAAQPEENNGKVTTKVTANYAGEKTATLIVAVYAADGSLKNVVTKDGKATRGSDLELSIEKPSMENTDTWKAFVWNNLTDITPLVSAKN